MPKINHDEELENARIKYQTSLNLFSSEGQIQWSRYNVMLVINTLLFGLIGLDRNIELSKSFPILFRFASLFGLILCYLWHRMTERGFIWMNHWIYEAKKLEETIQGQSDPIQNGAELRLKIGGDVTRNASLLIIKIFILLYLLFTVINIGPLIIQK